MDKIDIFLSELEELQLESIETEISLILWKANAISLISRIYGRDSIQVRQISNIDYSKNTPIPKRDNYGKMRLVETGDNLDKCRIEATGLVKNFIHELKTFGLPTIDDTIPHPSNGFVLTVNQQQTQNQTINLNIILDLIKSELTHEQLLSIKEIMRSNESAENKKISMFEKMKSFGLDVVSNVIAAILTNPNLVSG